MRQESTFEFNADACVFRVAIISTMRKAEAAYTSQHLVQIKHTMASRYSWDVWAVLVATIWDSTVPPDAGDSRRWVLLRSTWEADRPWQPCILVRHRQLHRISQHDSPEHSHTRIAHLSTWCYYFARTACTILCLPLSEALQYPCSHMRWVPWFPVSLTSAAEAGGA